jgi:hydrophobic/amphiphilic exporter-1 (mainly G- bacteria), HAE1 family
MHLIEAFVRNPVKISVGVLLLALFGIVALLRMPLQLTPEVEIPVISVQTVWPGASPLEVEQEIIQEQEEQLKSVEGVTKMTSECMDSVGTITLEFTVGTNMEEALLRVSNRLQQVPEYPEDADPPVVSSSSSSDRPIAWFILTQRLPDEEVLRNMQQSQPAAADELDVILRTPNPGLASLRLRRLVEKYPEVQQQLPPDIDVPTLRKFSENVIEARFERVEGVSNSNVLGGREEELQVVVDPQQLAARELTIADLRQALRQHNLDTSAGDLWEGKRRYVVRTLGQFRSPQDVADMLIRVQDGEPVHVHDVANVRLGYKKPDGFVRRYSSSCIAVNVVRETSANVFDVMAGLSEATAELNEFVLHDQGLQLTQVYDETDYIRSAVGLVNQNIILGGALTIIVLMLFLHAGLRTYLTVPLIGATALLALVASPWYFALTLLIVFISGLWFARGSLVVGLAIPISIVGTFLVMQQLGRSLNVISLAGLAFAVGMLVDNAVVVLENIYRHHQLGRDPFQAAVVGVQEVWGAVIASTLTTLAVFVPVLFVEEEAGQLFRDIALAISAAVGLSLIVSVTVVPTAASRLLHRRAGRGDRTPPKSYVANGLVAINRWALGGVIRKIVVAGTMIGISLGGTYWMWPRVEYLPTGNRNLVICLLLPPPGYNLEQLKAMGQFVEDELRPYWDVDPDPAAQAALPYPAIADFFYVARGRSVFLGLRCEDPDRVDELLALVETLRPKLAGTILVANKSSLFDRGLSAGRTIDIEITGPDLEKLVAVGGRIMREVGTVAGYPNPLDPAETAAQQARQEKVEQAQARPIPSLDLSSPEVHVIPKTVQTAELGITTQELGYSVNALIDGAYATDYMFRGYQIDLTIMGDERYVANTQDLAGLPIATPNGRLVPIGAVAQVVHRSGPEQVNHRERQRAITVQVTPPARVALEDAIERIESQILGAIRREGMLSGDYQITLSGTADKLRMTWSAMRWNLLLALLITYLLMAALFESWKHPLVIICSVPLGAVGGIAALHLLNYYLAAQRQLPQALDILTMLGFVILIGTVVNNAILLVHQSLIHLRQDGMQPTEAILESVRTRIRPIFMTTGTTVLGLAPLVFFPGAGSELYRGLGAIVLGGLFVSTVFTLILIPVLFSLMLDWEHLWLRLCNRLGWVAQPELESAPWTDTANGSGNGDGDGKTGRRPAKSEATH